MCLGIQVKPLHIVITQSPQSLLMHTRTLFGLYFSTRGRIYFRGLCTKGALVHCQSHRYYSNHIFNMSVNTKQTIASFGGKLLKQTHDSKTVGTEMEYNIFIPDSADSGKKVPLLIFLSGLTCTGDNCAQKGFYQHGATKHNIAVLYPDTSPRTLALITHPPIATATFLTTILTYRLITRRPETSR